MLSGCLSEDGKCCPAINQGVNHYTRKCSTCPPEIDDCNGTCCYSTDNKNDHVVEELVLRMKHLNVLKILVIHRAVCPVENYAKYKNFEQCCNKDQKIVSDILMKILLVVVIT